MNEFQTIYQQIKEEKILLLSKYFYQEVGLQSDLRALYPEDLEGAEERLFLFLLQVFGGPTTYSESRGHPRLRMRHLNWKIDSHLRNVWLNCMLKAIDKLGIEQNAKGIMQDYFVKAANHMINHQ
ncbi:globin domain-containing protein [Anditalea andensis]|uniref:Cyanoglobin n=1 Tax=Anditalea andensis TaxID=1048983 RepID=A0A074L4H6_9BACT|nr:cyanoglobin [Anditalea andensis]KEO74763.1 cyanoglobin [Anditalea andensis]